jgi:iron complex transport system substrate-binding protein
MRILCLLLCLLWALPATAAEDLFGRKLSWPAKPQRIVSLSPATTEMIYAIGAQGQLVGVTHDCNYPPEAARKTQLGKFGSVNLEALIRAKPDLILVTAEMRTVLAPLKRLNVPILAFQAPQMSAIPANLRSLGKYTAQAAGAEKAALAMEKELRSLPHVTQKPSVFYLLWDNPLITASPSSFVGDVLNRAGGHNVVKNTQAPFPHYSLEALLKADPQVLIVPQSVADRLHFNKPPFDRLQAVRQQRILRVDDDLISRPGPRVTQAMQQIAAYLRHCCPR